MTTEREMSDPEKAYAMSGQSQENGRHVLLPPDVEESLRRLLSYTATSEAENWSQKGEPRDHPFTHSKKVSVWLESI